MTLFGIDLRRPSFNEVTAATIMATGLWVACVGLLLATGQPLTRTDAGAALVVLLWGCLGARMGVRVGQGTRHLFANVVVSGALLLVYQGVMTLYA